MSESFPPHPQMADYVGGAGLAGKRALVCGGDSGIGRAVSVAFAKAGVTVAFAYLENDEAAARTRDLIEQVGSRAFPIRADLSEQAACVHTVEKAAAELGGLDILVNHHGRYLGSKSVNSFLWLTRAALEYLGDGASIINTGPVDCFLTYSLAEALRERGIRVNAVAPLAVPPDEIVASYIRMASAELSGYSSGEILAPIGGEV